MSTFENAKVGDKVWCSFMGDGVIKHIDQTFYPIGVSFDCNNKYYKTVVFTTDGLATDLDLYPSLFWVKHEFYRVTERPEPEIDWSKVPVDTLVQVKSHEDLAWTDRYLLNGYNNVFRAFEQGKVSKNAELIYTWSFCRIHPSVEIKEEWYVQ